MGSLETARVDTDGLRGVAREYDTAAAIVDAALRHQLGGMRFGGATAGRDHTARGDRLAGAVDGLSAALRQWSRSAAEIAIALRGSADRYQDAEARCADRVG